MSKNVWLIGSSSEFSKSIVAQFSDCNVTLFGRSNVDYSDFDLFIKDKTLPDIVIFNANVTEQVSITITDHTFDNKEMITSLENFNDVYCFLIKLLKWLELSNEKIKFCLITSSITQWPFKYKHNISYAILRSMEQTALMSCATDNLKVIGISPSGVTHDLFEQYAIEIRKKAEDNDTLKIYDLYNNTSEVLDLKRFDHE